MSAPLNFIRSLPFRLTIYYAVVLLFALTIVYLVSYVLVSSLESRRVDTFLNTEMEEFRHLYELKGMPAITDEAITETRSIGTQDLIFRVMDANGAIVFETETRNFDVTPAQLTAALAGIQATTPVLMTLDARRNAPARLIAGPLGGDHRLAIVMSMRDEIHLINESMRLILVVMAVTGVAAVVLGYFLSRNALAGIHHVQHAADDIAGGNVSRRAPLGRRGDEVDRLAQAFNAMATRVEALLTQLRDANDQLAHELRSPLTHIRVRSELALTHAADPQTLQVVAGETVEACDRLLRTIDTILEMSETDSGMNTLPRESVRLDALLAQACELFTPLAQDAGIRLTVTTAPAAVTGAGAKLQRLFANLLDNAIKYTPRGGQVDVTLLVEGDRAVVKVKDTGRGIDPSDLPRVFERFYRGQRNEGVKGNGLGLPLARSIARAHGGDISVTSIPEEGSEFCVTLPCGS